MYISMNWIQEFVDLSGIDLMALIHQFSLSTAEVENEIFLKGSDLSGVVVAEIKSVENHPESKKLHLLKVDCGEAEPRTILSGIRKWYSEPEALIGKSVIIAANLAPRKIAGIESKGMILSAITGDEETLSMLTTMEDVIPGGSEVS